jgi:hypothetical protein
MEHIKPYLCLLFNMHGVYLDSGLFVFIYLWSSKNIILRYWPVWPTQILPRVTFLTVNATGQVFI